MNHAMAVCAKRNESLCGIEFLRSGCNGLNVMDLNISLRLLGPVKCVKIETAGTTSPTVYSYGVGAIYFAAFIIRNVLSDFLCPFRLRINVSRYNAASNLFGRNR